MDTDTRAAELREFLRNLYGDRKVSLAQATITDRGKMTQAFHEGANRLKPWSMSLEGQSRSMINKSDKGVEIFYAPTPMSGPSGRKKEQALPNLVVFGDADEGLTPDAKAKLIELGACLVRSGGIHPTNGPKYHIYLLLTKEVPPHELERLNRGLKTFIRGDKFDSTTLLRLPGTRNHKYMKDGHPGTSPIVRVERLADARHTPENLAKFLGVVDADGQPTPLPADSTKIPLPNLPEGFNWRDNKPGYARMRKIKREWDQRFDDPIAGQSVRRYMAAIAIVKEAIKHKIPMDVAYAFASTCEPLVDKQEEENGYSIRKDVAKIWRREAGMAPSGTLTADDILSARQTDEAKNKTTTSSSTPPVRREDIGEVVRPGAFNHDGEGPDPYSSRDSRGYLDMAIFTSGDFQPLEPEFFSIDGQFCLLYPGMTHCIFGDSGSGKTWIVVAQIAAELKAGRRVKFIDFENGARTIGNRLHNVLGVPAELLTPDRFKYMWFNDKPDPAEIQEEADEAYDLVVIDGVDASMALWDIDYNKAPEVRKWYNEFPQKFADAGSTVLSIDHTTKKSSTDTKPKEQQPGGAGTKLAVLTGAAFFVHPKDGYELVPGRRGVVEGWITRKDKDGFLKAKARKDGLLFQFIIDNHDGETLVGFEAVKEEKPNNVKPSAEEVAVIQTLKKIGKPIAKGQLVKRIGGNRQAAYTLLNGMEGKGFIQVTPGSNGAHEISLAASAPPSSRDVDMTYADSSGRREGRRECSKCGEMEILVKPDEVGYVPNRPLCAPCASENIESETYIPRDGAEWARRIRVKRDQRNSSHEDV